MMVGADVGVERVLAQVRPGPILDVRHVEAHAFAGHPDLTVLGEVVPL